MKALAGLLLLATADPRPVLVELQLAGRQQEALARTEEALAEDPETMRPLGLDYLRGHLLEQLGRRSEAHGAFVDALASSPELAGYSRYRLAVNQFRLGHPEVTAGLLATLLAGGSPEPLVQVASGLLVQSIGMGGDCRLLERLTAWNLPAPERRRLELTRADCALRAGQSERAEALLQRLLEEATDDDTARAAAQRLHLLRPPGGIPGETSLLIGFTFHRHREFPLAIQYLEQGLEAEGNGGASRTIVFDAGYAIARSLFWENDYSAAASRFNELARSGASADSRAEALYQEARAYELDGNWETAAAVYALALAAEPTGRWAPAALFAEMRMAWRRGHEPQALGIYAQLLTRRQWWGTAGRAALFLASSDLVRGRTERVRAWLDQAARSNGTRDLEVAYWRGRLAEAQGQDSDAVRYYLAALQEDFFHPLAQDGLARLAAPALAAATHAEGLRLAASERTHDLEGAWYLLTDGDPKGREAHQHLERHLRKNPPDLAFLDLHDLPPAEWPVWQARLDKPEELLLALGILEQGSSAVREFFPVSQASLGYTGSRLLSWAGLNRSSLYYAEVLSKRAPRDLPQPLLPTSYRELLFPVPYRALIEREARRFGVPPFLLAALIREESRFDPLAISSASARGLTQFVLPTARRLAARLGIEQLEAQDLHRPEVSIALGAAHLAELADEFDGRTHIVVAAYNAGERQAELWRSYCYSLELGEFFTKVGFSETRDYLRKVLSSEAQYASIYGGEPVAEKPGP